VPGCTPGTLKIVGPEREIKKRRKKKIKRERERERERERGTEKKIVTSAPRRNGGIARTFAHFVTRISIFGAHSLESSLINRRDAHSNSANDELGVRVTESYQVTEDA